MVPILSKSKKTILHITETLTGGVATVVTQLSEFDGCSYLIGPESQAKDVSSFSGDRFWFKHKSRSVLALLRCYFLAVKVSVSLKPNIIHLHSSFALPLAPFLKFFLFFYKSKILYQPHGVFYDPDVPRAKAKIVFIKMLERFFCVFIDGIVCISEHEAMAVTKLHGFKKTHLLRNAVAPSNVKYSSKGRVGYLFVGRLDEQKGIDILTEFWSKKIPDEILTVVGSTVRGGVEVAESNNIKYLGWVGAAELDLLYSKAKAVIVPSRWEGFGLVVIEAFRNGTPVIASNKGALPELVGHEKTGYILDFNTFEVGLLRSISNINNLEGVFEDLSIACLDEYQSKYTLSKYLISYECLIDCFVDKK